MNLTDLNYAVKQIKQYILKSRYVAARLANKEMLNLYYTIGKYISENTRGKDKWGTGALDDISNHLSVELPGLKGFSAGNMRKMRIFYEEWNEVFDVSSLNTYFASLADTADLQQNTNRALITHDLMESFSSVGFTHHYEIIKMTTTLSERIYYITKCASNFWSVDILRNHLKNNDYHRIGQMPNNFSNSIPTPEQASRAVMSFKDELLLDFVNIEEATDSEDIDERVLENQIVQNVKKFIQTLGTDFCFIGNQHRLEECGEEFFVDLLFYHRSLHRLIAIELKRGKFKPIYIGQLNFYLSLLDKYERHSDEEGSIGIILCKEAQRSIVELSVRDFTKPMGVITYKLGDKIPDQLQPLLPIMEAAEHLLDYKVDIVDE